jgi:hypothetical protein
MFFRAGTKVNLKYINVLQTKPWTQNIYGLGADYVLQQYGMPYHTSRRMQALLMDYGVKI